MFPMLFPFLHWHTLKCQRCLKIGGLLWGLKRVKILSIQQIFPHIYERPLLLGSSPGFACLFLWYEQHVEDDEYGALVKWYGRLKYWQKIVSRCQFVHHKSHVEWPGIERVRLRWKAKDWQPEMRHICVDYRYRTLYIETEFVPHSGQHRYVRKANRWMLCG